MQHLARLRLQRVAAQMLVLLLHLPKLFEDAIHLIGAIRIFQTAMQGFELVVQIADPAAARDRFVQHRAAAHLLYVLPEVADGELFGHRDFALVGSFLAHDHAEERRLPCRRWDLPDPPFRPD